MPFAAQIRCHESECDPNQEKYRRDRNVSDTATQSPRLCPRPSTGLRDSPGSQLNEFNRLRGLRPRRTMSAGTVDHNHTPVQVVIMDTTSVCSKCGFHCSRCPAFENNSRTEADRKRGSALWEKYFGLHFKPDVVRCEGCQANAPWKDGNLLPDRTCPIRACAVFNGAATCAHCSLFQCDEYSRRVPGADLRQQRERAIGLTIGDDEYLEHIEPFEGQTHLVRIRTALTAADITPPREFSDATGVVPFPQTTNLPADIREEMRLLHALLEDLFTVRATTYAGKVLALRGMPYLWGIMWVMGLYGSLSGGRLVLESALHGDKKECSRLVRKTDTTLHSSIRQAVDTLTGHGVPVEFRPLGKNWTLTLGIEPARGGPAVLQGLKRYVSILTGKYGQSAYISNYNLKGKGFKLFTRVDMGDLCEIDQRRRHAPPRSDTIRGRRKPRT